MKNNKLIFLLVILLAAVGVMSVASAYTGTGFSHNIDQSQYISMSNNDILNKYNDTDCHIEASGVCTKVVDGDTIYVDGVGKIRLVGVNTPEKGVTGASASTYFVKKLCLNREVGLNIDDSKNQDKYGRTLAVVIIDGKNLNEMLLKEGLAEVMYIPPSEFYPYSWEDGTSHQTSSQATHTDSTSSAAGSYVASINSNKFHYPSCKWAGKISDKNKITFSTRDEAINNGYQPCKVCTP